MPTYSFVGEQKYWSTPPETSHSKISNHVDIELHYTQDGVMMQDGENMSNGINFDSRLKQFKQMQQEHRVNAKSQAQLRKSSVNMTKVATLLFPWLLFLYSCFCHCTVILES